MSIEKVPTIPKLSEVVLNTLIQSIADGKIEVGKELMPERDLAEVLGVGRGSLRECLVILEFLGIIESKRNRKIVVRDTEAIERAMTLIQLSRQQNILSDYVDFRCMIEPMIAEMACEHATKEDIQQLEELQRRLKNNMDDMEADYRFHVVLAYATHNSVIAAVMDYLVVMVRSIREMSLSIPGRPEEAYGEHGLILEAVKRGDSEMAKMAMQLHLKKVRTVVESSKELDLQQNTDGG